MKFIIFYVSTSLMVYLSSGASLPETPERKDNVIVLEVASKGPEGENRRSKTSLEDQEGEPFEIIVPVARNFSSLEELFQILREDDHKEPRGAGESPSTYVKGTERNSSDFLIFFADGVTKSKGST